MPAKRLPLPKRFNVALTEQAYENLRKLNERYRFGNNYLLTVLLENLQEVVDVDALENAFSAFAKEYGQPAAGSMTGTGETKAT